MKIRHNSCIMLSIIFLCLSLINHLSFGTDTISGNQSLSGDQTIVSSGGNFELGFFKPGNSSNFYVGMWYKKVSVQTIVWVANRETPISNKNLSVLIILNGNLVLLDYESQTTVWSTNIASNYSVVAILGDDGNLVLKDGSSSAQQPIWQSFDYPTHTFLPGSKIGFNNINNISTYLTSWKNLEDPSTGLFSLELDRINSRYILQLNSRSSSWNRSVLYWSSGSWNGEKFSMVPATRLDSIYNFSYVSNGNESYFTYSLYNTSIISRLIMDVSGQIKELTWLDSSSEWSLVWYQPRQVSEIYGYCGEFGIYNQNVQPSCSCLPGFVPKYLNDWNLGVFSGGCARKIGLQCGEDNTYVGKEREFTGKSHMAFPGATYAKLGRSPTECESFCLSRCECAAYAYHPADGMCQYWNFTLFYLQQLADTESAGMTLYFRPAASEILSPNNTNTTTTTPTPSPTATGTTANHNNKAVVIGSVIGSVVVSVAVMGLVIFWRWTNKHGGRNKSFNTGFFLSKRHASLLNNDVDQGGSSDIPFFHLKSIIAATDGFSVANKLGQGGFGPVYKGNLPSGQKIAVKRLSTNSGQGIKEFKNEVILISKLQHRNLVKLLGFCVEGDEKLLIYEYMPNKSLDAFLPGSSERGILDWDQRYKIIEGIARGLLYLHRDSRLRVIHRDLKPGNILLDEEMNPKISDFGMAKMFGGNQTLVNTNRIVGTYGYMSPEYAMQGLFSEKSDVFSFGVLLLEMVSSKKNTSFYHHEKHLNLLGYAWQLWNEGKALDLLDPRLANSKSHSQVMRCIHVGLLSVQEQAEDRPTMSTIIFMLCNEATLPTPKQPAFILNKGSTPSDSSLPNNVTCSTNCVSITTIGGR